MHDSATTGRATCLLALWLLVNVSGPALSETQSPSVLLTFDAEVDEDAAALRRLDLDVPATYFFTGTFVERHPKLVASLAGDNTIGSHTYSHADLSQLDGMELRKELLLPKLIIEKATGSAPIWFRAPYLSYNDQVMPLLRELGFRFDSSDQERWVRDDALTELPISVDAENHTLASDWDLFEQKRLTDKQALDWLQRQYDDRAVTGRPLVFLMHPRIIVEHAHALVGFIDYVHKQGGVFRTADDWLRTATERSSARWGTWVDFSLGPHDPETIAADIVGAGLTDVFLMARDPAGNVYFSDGEEGPPANPGDDLFGETIGLLRAEGVRVHAWLPVFHNSYLAQLRPDWAMVAGDGSNSLDWVAPSHPEVKADFLATVRELVTRYDLDGIHLDYYRYPSLRYDVGPRAVAAFAADAGLDDLTADQALSEHYMGWTDWRNRLLAEFAREIKDTITQTSDGDVILSAALIADAALSYRSMEENGQDYSSLAKHLDVVIPMAYFKEDRQPIDWIEDVVTATRYRVGATPVFIGVEGYQKPEHWTHNTMQFATALDKATTGSDGLVIYPYLYMFGRGESEWNMPPSSLPTLRAAMTAVVPDADPDAAETEMVLPATGAAVDEAPGATASLAPDRDPVWGGLAVGVLTMAGLVGLGIVVAASHRKRWLLDPSAPMPALLPAPGASREELALADWSRIQSEPSDEHLAKLLRQLGPIGIERCRVTFVLDALERLDGNLAAVLDELSQVEGWSRLALRYLEETSLLGHVSLDGNRAALTPLGVRHLRQAREQGFKGSLWQAVEARLHERVRLTCHNCGTLNLGHWFWQNVECIECRNRIEVKRSGSISERRVTPPSRELGPDPSGSARPSPS